MIQSCPGVDSNKDDKHMDFSDRLSGLLSFNVKHRFSLSVHCCKWFICCITLGWLLKLKSNLTRWPWGILILPREKFTSTWCYKEAIVETNLVKLQVPDPAWLTDVIQVTRLCPVLLVSFWQNYLRYICTFLWGHGQNEEGNHGHSGDNSYLYNPTFSRWGHTLATLKHSGAIIGP